MYGPIDFTLSRLRPLALAAAIGLAGASLASPAFARGPENIADVAEKVIDAVVNISTTQNVVASGGGNERGGNLGEQLHATPPLGKCPARRGL